MSGGVRYVEFTVALPDDASVEIDTDERGHLRAYLEVPNDAAALALLSDALRAAVIEVDQQRAVLRG